MMGPCCWEVCRNLAAQTPAFIRALRQTHQSIWSLIVVMSPDYGYAEHSLLSRHCYDTMAMTYDGRYHHVVSKLFMVVQKLQTQYLVMLKPAASIAAASKNSGQQAM